jgi:transcriptional regulator of acetoin/glycerol metabolism
MRNVLRTAVALLGDGHEITVDELSEDFMEQAGQGNHSTNQCGEPSPASSDSLLSDAEARHISSALDRNGGNIAATARTLGVGRSTLYRKLRGQMTEN